MIRSLALLSLFVALAMANNGQGNYYYSYDTPDESSGYLGSDSQGHGNSHSHGNSQAHTHGQGNVGHEHPHADTDPNAIPEWAQNITSKWTQREQCTCFCFNRDGMINPPAWIPGQAPERGTKPQMVQPPPNAGTGTIFGDPVFLGGPPLWDTDNCRARNQGEIDYNIRFFCTCCCPKIDPISGQYMRVNPPGGFGSYPPSGNSGNSGGTFGTGK